MQSISERETTTESEPPEENQTQTKQKSRSKKKKKNPKKSKPRNKRKFKDLNLDIPENFPEKEIKKYVDELKIWLCQNGFNTLQLTSRGKTKKFLYYYKDHNKKRCTYTATSSDVTLAINSLKHSISGMKKKITDKLKKLIKFDPKSNKLKKRYFQIINNSLRGTPWYICSPEKIKKAFVMNIFNENVPIQTISSDSEIEILPSSKKKKNSKKNKNSKKKIKNTKKR
ncbi:hypothetical protein M0813_16871 [Anaeramoeba flamelloides]|uniref:Uncharacterized protein n=1 Tax=Anaeramoeba flamelloides TaxID=1746091 RepID=A0ABQ8YXU2_9EUKA|nr:hypothetical protein M0813_16871 [Anaeramoeba flamelloides]